MEAPLKQPVPRGSGVLAHSSSCSTLKSEAGGLPSVQVQPELQHTYTCVHKRAHTYTHTHTTRTPTHTMQAFVLQTTRRPSPAPSPCRAAL